MDRQIEYLGQRLRALRSLVGLGLVALGSLIIGEDDPEPEVVDEEDDPVPLPPSVSQEGREMVFKPELPPAPPEPEKPLTGSLRDRLRK